MLLQRLIALMALCLFAAAPLMAADPLPAPTDTTPAVESAPASPEEVQTEAAMEASQAAPAPQAMSEEGTTPEAGTAPPEQSAAAATDERYQVYVVQKGDTLWGISRRFIEDPYYWPDLWANNPEVRNPHFIYPGQKLQIYSGPIMVMPAQPPVPEPPVVAETPLAPAPADEQVASVPSPPVEPEVLITIPRGAGYVATEEADSVGRIYDFTEARQLAATGDTVFVHMNPEKTAQAGDRFDIFATMEEIRHPVTKKAVGHKIVELGTLEVIATHEDVDTAVLGRTYREVTRGAWLTPHRTARQTVALKKAAKDLQGYVVSSYYDRVLQGEHDVIYVDLGERQGLTVGNLLTVTRPRKATEANKDRSKKSIRLPDELVGYALVVETRATTATAVLIKALGPTLIGDRVKTQTGR